MAHRISYLLQFSFWLEFISGLGDKELYKRQKRCILTYLAHATKLALLNFALPANACRKRRQQWVFFFFFWQPVCIALHKITGNQSAQVQLFGGGGESCPQKNLSPPVTQKRPKYFHFEEVQVSLVNYNATTPQNSATKCKGLPPLNLSHLCRRLLGKGRRNLPTFGSICRITIDSEHLHTGKLYPFYGIFQDVSWSLILIYVVRIWATMFSCFSSWTVPATVHAKPVVVLVQESCTDQECCKCPIRRICINLWVGCISLWRPVQVSVEPGNTEGRRGWQEDITKAGGHFGQGEGILGGGVAPAGAACFKS